MIWVTSGRLLGHVVCKEGLLVDPKKIGVAASLPPSTNVKELTRFLGVATHHIRFIWMCAEIMRTLYSQLKKEKKYEWTEECQRTFNEVKKILTTTPILVCPNWTIEFHIHCDASNVAIGAALAQNIYGKEDSPISYASRFYIMRKIIIVLLREKPWQ